MIDCREFLEGGQYEDIYDNDNKMKLISKLTEVKHDAKFLCPHNVEKLNVRGHYGARYFDYVSIKVRACDQGPEFCYPIEQAINRSMNFYQLRASPSLENAQAEEVISYTADLSYVKFVDPNVEQHTNIFFMSSEITYSDNIWDIFDFSEKTQPLYEISRMVDYTIRSAEELSEKTYLSLFFRLESQSRIYKRIGYDILTYLGDLGGLLDFVLMMGILCSSFFASKLFSAALIGQLYRVQGYSRDYDQFYETKDAVKLTTESDSDENGLNSSSVSHASGTERLAESVSNNQLHSVGKERQENTNDVLSKSAPVKRQTIKKSLTDQIGSNGVVDEEANDDLNGRTLHNIRK